MNNAFFRTSLIIGEENIKKLSDARVWVFGCGGVGGYVIEALARSGVGHIRAVDMDVIDETNINRQIFALHSTLGLPKAEVAKKRCADINPDIEFTAVNKMFSADTESEFDFSDADYIIDAIDTVTSKLLLIKKANEMNIPVVSSMGTGNKLDPALLTEADIYETHGDPLARVMRRELKKLGIKSLKTVYSPEKPIEQRVCEEGKTHPITASTPWVPPAAGLIIASVVVRDICGL